MKANELRKGNWYKFYSKSNRNYWDILCKEDGNGKMVEAYISHFDNKRDYNKGGFFSEEENYEPSSMEEINQFLPEGEKVFTNYNIY